ncbi:FHA domain-containing protein [bacterium]|nr:FHA domain-containing protein [bacterium]
MKDLLTKTERYLQALVEENASRILGTPQAEKQLIHEIINEMGKQIRMDAQGNPTSPNIFSLIVPSEYAEDVRSNQSLLDQLANNITQAGKKAGVYFDGAITISVFPEKTLQDGEFAVRAIWKDGNLSETHPIDTQSIELHSNLLPPRAFLIVGGTQIYTLEEDTINIGRLYENDLVIDDPRVSRRHAQIRVVKGRHMLFDLGSSGGTYVNNLRITQVTLHPGDVLSLAGVPLVYGQDALSHIEETKEYIPPKDIDSGSTTTVGYKTTTDPHKK